MMLFSFYCLILLISFLLTWVLRRYALAASLLDIPNHRSSHVVPTPRGGGLSFVLCFLSTALILTCLNIITVRMFIAVLGAGSLIAILGFLDDHGHIAAKWRLSGHFIAAGFALYMLGGMPALPVFIWTLPAGIICNLLIIFYLVWLLNLYNFMDGINGIAAIEAIFVCFSAAFLYYLAGNTLAMMPLLALGMAVGGFLIWNFPVARIFMGDAGSGFLGIVLGIFSIQAAIINPDLFWCWLILLGVFIVDTSITLFSRILQRQAFFTAHCTHAYQHASRYYGSHSVVTLAVLTINLLWLLPIALIVDYNLINGFVGLMIAYAPLIVIAIKFRAGMSE